MKQFSISSIAVLAAVFLAASASAQMGKRFPSEKKTVPDPVTGVPLTFLTTGPSNDNKIYQTHPQWTSDGKWLIFRSSDRVPGEGTQAFAVNEESGVIVQVTDKGYMGMLCVARKSMKLYIMRNTGGGPGRGRAPQTQTLTLALSLRKGEGISSPPFPGERIKVRGLPSRTRLRPDRALGVAVGAGADLATVGRPRLSRSTSPKFSLTARPAP